VCTAFVRWDGLNQGVRSWIVEREECQSATPVEALEHAGRPAAEPAVSVEEDDRPHERERLRQALLVPGE
jgi:hypothetical protein